MKGDLVNEVLISIPPERKDFLWREFGDDSDGRERGERLLISSSIVPVVVDSVDGEVTRGFGVTFRSDALVLDRGDARSSGGGGGCGGGDADTVANRGSS